MALNKIKNLQTGTLDLDAVTKVYVDNLVKEKCEAVAEIAKADLQKYKSLVSQYMINIPKTKRSVPTIPLDLQTYKDLSS